MKQKLFLSLLGIALGTLTAFAGEPQRLILNAGNVEHVTIQSDMEIVLLQAPADEHSIILDQNALDKLNLKLNNKTLFISEKKGSSKEKMVVYLYVNNLKTLSVEGNSKITTIGALETRNLDVFVDGNAWIHLRTNGTVKAYSLNDSDFAVKYISGKTVTKRGF